MDILIHTFSGIAVASTIAHLVPAEEKRSLSIIGIGALGGALPDFDAISLWSKFDDTIGTWLQLAVTDETFTSTPSRIRTTEPCTPWCFHCFL